MAGASELVNWLVFKTNPGEEMKLRDLANVLGDMSMSSVLAATGLGAAGAALGDFAERTSVAALSLQNLSLYTGVPVKDIQQWEEYAETIGIAKGEVDSLFTTFVNRVGQLKLTGEGLAVLNQLGINPNEKNPEKQFLQMVDRLSSYKDVGVRNTLAKALGLDQAQTTLAVRMAGDPDALKKISERPFTSEADLAKWAELATTWKMMTQDTIILLQKMTPIAEFLTFVAKGANLAHVTENAKRGLYGPQLQLYGEISRIAGTFAGGGNHVANHITINVTSTGDAHKDAKKIAKAVHDEEVMKSYHGFGGPTT